jgi:hypothetical protein
MNKKEISKAILRNEVFKKILHPGSGLREMVGNSQPENQRPPLAPANGGCP